MRAIVLPGLLTSILASEAHLQAQAPCIGDLNADRLVNGTDLGLLLGQWAGEGSADLNSDGFVDGVDLGLLLAGWGTCPVVTPVWATLVEALPDPAVVTDPSLRQRIAETGLAWRVLDTATQTELLLVPPGVFLMGCIMGSSEYRCYSQYLPVHHVTLTAAFYLGRYEVTQSQWSATIGSNPSGFRGYPDSASRPVEHVSWNTVQGYLGATGFRLPTEAEWEYACRAGTQTPLYNGSADGNTVWELAWHSLNSGGQTRPVGGKSANALGFHDMLGNVWEWVNDWSGSYSPEPQINPTGPSSAVWRVLRGGSWGNGPGAARSDNRNFHTPGWTHYFHGFRVARDP